MQFLCNIWFVRYSPNKLAVVKSLFRHFYERGLFAELTIGYEEASEIFEESSNFIKEPH